MSYRTPWESEPAPVDVDPLPALVPPAKKRGRRPTAPSTLTLTSPTWLHHHLIVTGPEVTVADLAVAARGAGVIPWRIDSTAVEEMVFNLAASQPVGRRRLDITGCRILARQFRDRVEARQARAAARVGTSLACAFDLHTLLPVPDDILQHGPAEPASLAWMRQHWGISDGLRQVTQLPDPRPGRRLPKGHAVLGYGFFTAAETPHAAVETLAQRWPSLRLALQPRPD